jgi:hypothetical protein
VKNYYRILQIDISAEIEIVEAAYRRLMKKYHPDVAVKSKGEFVDNDEKVKDIIEAYQVLSNDDKRRDYDNTFWNNARETKYEKFDDVDPSVISKSIIIKCSVSSKTYKMHLVKNSNWTGPYIVKAFEMVNEENVVFSEGNKRWNLHNLIGKNIRAIVKKEDIDEEEIHLGDIDWSGIKCPDCGKVVQVKPGLYSSFSVCSKCHRMKCMGDAIKGVAGYYTRCPWCGKSGLIADIVKTGGKGGSRITGVLDNKADHSIPRLPETKLLEKK